MKLSKQGGNESRFFPEQDPDESIILVVRKHKLVLLLPFLWALLFAVLLTVIYSVFTYSDIVEISSLVKAIIVCVISIMFLFTILYAFSSWLIKYLDILILTSKHLVVVRQNSFFSRSTSVLDLATIQDVATSQEGFIQTIVGYGRITVQTAGEMPNFAYNNVGSPIEIQDAIMDAKSLYADNKKEISSSIVKEHEASIAAKTDSSQQSSQ